ncbi:MAG: hypothetical protein FWG10_03360 [Eubacteriaceae bacterium]|nr:hypothetical protein [Eubacteriaceae bacterium]
MINPFSLLSFFSHERFAGYWFSSGTPSFLISLLKSKPESFLSLKNLVISERVLDKSDIRKIEAEPLLYQSGYLTIKEKRFDTGYETCLLKIPNFEVEEALHLGVVAEFTEQSETFTESAYLQKKESLKTGDLQNMLEFVKSPLRIDTLPSPCRA